MRVVSMIVVQGVLLLVLAGAVFAGLDKEEQAKVDTLAAVLDLSAQQKAAVVREREAARQTLLRLEEEWQGLHDRLRQEVRADEPDQAKIDEISASIGRIRGEIIALRTKSLVFLKSVLTPEQMKILENDHGRNGEAELPKQ